MREQDSQQLPDLRRAPPARMTESPPAGTGGMTIRNGNEAPGQRDLGRPPRPTGASLPHHTATSRPPHRDEIRGPEPHARPDHAAQPITTFAQEPGKRAASTRTANPQRRHPPDHRPRHGRLGPASASPTSATATPTATSPRSCRSLRPHPDPAPALLGLHRPLGHRDHKASTGQ
jgi:hypothetical protein